MNRQDKPVAHAVGFFPRYQGEGTALAVRWGMKKVGGRMRHSGIAYFACAASVGVCACAFVRAGGEVPATPTAGGTTKPASAEELIERARLMATIAALPTKRAAWGDEEHKAGLRQAEAWIAGELRALGYDPVLEPVDFLGNRRRGSGKEPEKMEGEPSSEGGGADDGGQPPVEEKKPVWNNVYVDLPGNERADEWLIIGAHFDAVVNSPGADDNGTGVACLLEMARVMKGRRLQRSVRLIFFNLEEVGLVGSRAHALRVKQDADAGKMKVVGMVSLDMLGFYSSKPGSQRNPLGEKLGGLEVPTRAEFIGLGGVLGYRKFSQAFVKGMNEAEGRMKVVAADFLPIAPPDLLRSDHAPFLLLGMPAVILSDTANFRNPNYHKPTDTIQTLDAERFEWCVRAVTGATVRLAGEEGEEVVELK